jgi:AGZA family xanthine/uracil permease-like MFS transporter
VLGKQIPWPVALGIVFWSGVLFLLVSVTPLRVLIAGAIPHNLRVGAALGIGLFLTFIGLKNAGLVVADPVTFVKFGRLGPAEGLALGGLFLAAVLQGKRIPGAYLISILAVTVLGFALGLVKAPAQWVAWPDFHSVFFRLDPVRALSPAYLSAMVATLFTDLFDSVSTFVGVAQATNLLEPNGEAKNLRQGLVVDAWATLTAGLFGTSSGTAYIESAAGIEAGGRTGLASVFTALCFLPFLFLAPLAGLVPAFATAPILILVGGSMFKTAAELRFRSVEEWLPAFLTVVLIPLTFSITQGILWGFISHVLLFTLAGRRRELRSMLVAIALVSVGLLWLERG